MLRVSGILVVALLWTIAFTSPASACVEPADTLAAPDVSIRIGISNTAKIVFHDYETFGSVSGEFCACALNDFGPPIVSVNGAVLIDVGSGQVVPGFAFEPNNTTSAGFAAVVAENWAGFASETTETIPAGDPVDLWFDVSFEPGTTFSDLAAALAGAGFVVATDAADSSGAPTGAHEYILEAGSIGDIIPTLSEWGMLGLLLLLVVAGGFFIRRQYRQVRA